MNDLPFLPGGSEPLLANGCSATASIRPQRQPPTNTPGTDGTIPRGSKPVLANEHTHKVVGQGRCTLVGAGPGDPELLTLKAARAIASASLILVDDLVNDAVLEHASPTARIVHVGKRGGCKSTPQAFIDKLMITAVQEGEHVVRLKGGDPFIFGRGGEEVEHLRAAGIDVEVVNGITSGLAGMSSLGAPLCYPRQGVLNRGQHQQKTAGVGEKARQDKQCARDHHQNIRGQRPRRIAAGLQGRLQVALGPFALTADQPDAEDGRAEHDRKCHPKAKPGPNCDEKRDFDQGKSNDQGKQPHLIRSLSGSGGGLGPSRHLHKAGGGRLTTQEPRVPRTEWAIP